MKIRASLLATALACMPFAADAAGLGKITVYSGLGQPLRAEVEISATKAEISGMTARMAPRDSFAQAGIEYASTLQGIKFVLDQKGDKPVIRITSDRPVNDPFVDLLLELSWPSGRLVREYTFLLDPPELVVKGAPQISAVEARELPALADAPAPRATVDKPVRGASRPRVAEEKKAPEAAKPPADGAGIQVKKGDTLNKIASENRPEGVSLDQMLVGLLRANKEAFDNGNMNRLKAGRILTVPDQEALTAVSPGEARKIVVAQSSDWNAYRRKLAAAAAQSPVRDDGGQQAASGKVSARVEDQAAPAATPKDQVKVAKTQAAGGGKSGGSKVSEEDLIARDKAVKEANERVAALEKNVSDLQKLLEMKNQSLADLQKQSAAAPAPAASAPPAPPVAAEVKPEAKDQPAPKAETAATPEAPKAEEKPAEAPAAAEPKPAVPAPAPTPAPAAAVPPLAVAEPSLVDDLLGNPMLLAAGGAVVAGLGAIAVLRRRRQEKQESGAAEQPTISSLSQASLGANSVFKSTGGQSVDTSNTPATDFSQAGPGTIDTDEVDPVAEADVYMAYGRDAQAEEILLEAMQKDPKRFAIHVKLLEIYANRKSVPQFEALASDIYAQTGGVGADWEKAAAMGMRLDPANPLYQIAPSAAAVAAPAVPEFDPDATMIVGSGVLQEAMAPSEPAPMVEPEALPEPVATAAVEPADLAGGLDFDLDLGSPSPAEPQAPEAVQDSSLDFDLDLGAPSEAPAPAAAEATLPEVLDFQLPEVVAEPQVSAADENIIDFDLNPPSAESLDSLDSLEVPEPAAEAEAALAVEASPRAFDLSAISLDLESSAEPAPSLSLEEADVSLPDLGGGDLTLDQGEASPSPALPESAAEEVLVMPEVVEDLSFDMPGESPEGTLEISPAAAEDDPRWQEVATKLDLAKAYEEMGDLEGARELLQEVLSEGNPEQQERARSLLATMG